jgi:hypothetical protein
VREKEPIIGSEPISSVSLSLVTSENNTHSHPSTQYNSFGTIEPTNTRFFRASRKEYLESTYLSRKRAPGTNYLLSRAEKGIPFTDISRYKGTPIYFRPSSGVQSVWSIDRGWTMSSIQSCGVSSRWYIVIIKIEDSLGQVSQKSQLTDTIYISAYYAILPCLFFMLMKIISNYININILWITLSYLNVLYLWNVYIVP